MPRSTPSGRLEFLSPDEIRLKGHRIWLEHIVARSRRGMSAADIVADLPTLTLDETQDVLIYIATHDDEVQAYMARREAYLAGAQARQAGAAAESPVMARLRRLRDSLKAQGAYEAHTKSSGA